MKTYLDAKPSGITLKPATVKAHATNWAAQQSVWLMKLPMQEKLPFKMLKTFIVGRSRKSVQ
ncbi:hypothetical protein DPMN_036285 [Dreissena polymorpha]|uniref:Uncharacterized protein n=1 Tax=Dreissena polymorpha TaxID=45954 RepID=A0A9D4RLT1_DREPO|nr:hypothetical protein DPMN_036285 [Dreissena polymorpha]